MAPIPFCESRKNPAILTVLGSFQGVAERDGNWPPSPNRAVSVGGSWKPQAGSSGHIHPGMMPQHAIFSVPKRDRHLAHKS